MTECEIKNRLSAWLDEEMDQQSSAAISRHLQQCAACREEVRRLSGVYELLAQDDTVITDLFLAPRVNALLKHKVRASHRPAWVRHAFASLAVAAGLLLGFGLGNGLYQSLWFYEASQAEQLTDSGIWSETCSLSGQYAEAFRDGFSETGEKDE